jgi:hypothetical protein
MTFEAMKTILTITGHSMLLHVLCTFLLRRLVADDSDVGGEIFTKPSVAFTTTRPKYLRAKYFLPWTPSPEFLDEESVTVRLLFWGARISGGLAAAGFIAFPLVGTYLGTIGRS